MSSLLTGTGLKFPLEVDSGGRSVWITGVELINQSLGVLLLQPKNELYFLASYGTLIDSLLDEPNDRILMRLLETFIREAIQEFEKRIRVLYIDFEQGQDAINCTINYQLIGTTQEGVFVYPFYRELKF